MDRRTMPGARHGGFTLIELLIVIVIIGVLAAVGFPSYQAHVIKARRAGAQAFLMEIAQKEQQYLLDARSYAGSVASLNLTTPTEVSPYYTFTIDTAPSGYVLPAFVVTATPTGAQASDSTLTLDSKGVKAPSSVW